MIEWLNLLSWPCYHLALGVSTGSLFNVLLYPSSLQLFSYIQGWIINFLEEYYFPRIRQLEAYCLTQIQEFASTYRSLLYINAIKVTVNSYFLGTTG